MPLIFVGVFESERTRVYPRGWESEFGRLRLLTVHEDSQLEGLDAALILWSDFSRCRDLPERIWRKRGEHIPVAICAPEGRGCDLLLSRDPYLAWFAGEKDFRKALRNLMEEVERGYVLV